MGETELGLQTQIDQFKSDLHLRVNDQSQMLEDRIKVLNSQLELLKESTEELRQSTMLQEEAPKKKKKPKRELREADSPDSTRRKPVSKRMSKVSVSGDRLKKESSNALVPKSPQKPINNVLEQIPKTLDELPVRTDLTDRQDTQRTEPEAVVTEEAPLKVFDS